MNTEKSNINVSVNGIVVTDVSDELSSGKHSEDIQEIVTKIPSWIVRWGITLFFCIMLIAVSISVLVRYPDIIKVEVAIRSVNNSSPVVTKIAGKVSKLLVKSGQLIKSGQSLAYIDIDNWPGKTIVLTAPQDGKVAFVNIIKEGYFLKANQEIFHINAINEQFFGVIHIPQNQIYKVKIGQEVLIKLSSYPNEQYGQLKGNIDYIADEPLKEGFFVATISFDSLNSKKSMKLKNWMTGIASIITEDISLQSRIYNSVVKGLNDSYHGK